MSTLHVENLKGPTSGANANKIIVPSGQTLDASNGFVAPSGHVIQMQHATLAGASSNSSSTSYIDTGLTVNITPKFATSKILVIVNQQIGIRKAASGNNARCDMHLIENGSSTVLARSSYAGTDYQQTDQNSFYHSQNGVFQCSNTNQLTFKTQVRPANGAATSAELIYPAWYTGAIHNITALEIAQ